MAELRIFEPFGSGRREVEGGLVAKLRLKTDAHFKLASIWVPVEQRALGAVVWRPSLVPTAEVQAELDPGGWSGLLLAVAAPVRVELEEERQAFADLVMPGIVQQAGFASVEELRLAVRGEARKLVGDARLSEALQRLVEEAIQMQWLGQVVGADWRMLAKPWTAVLDLALAEVCLDLRPVVDALWDSGLPPLLPGWPQNWVGPSEAHVLQVVKKPKQELGQLRKRLDDQTDPLGFGLKRVSRRPVPALLTAPIVQLTVVTSWPAQCTRVLSRVALPTRVHKLAGALSNPLSPADSR
jgi:hypothetical protein